jgi:hypothetical protein
MRGIFGVCVASVVRFGFCFVWWWCPVLECSGLSAVRGTDIKGVMGGGSL